MLSAIEFKFGSAPGQPGLRIDTSPSVTIFVGPNNSGKSQALREINKYFSTGENAGGCIISKVDFVSFDEEEAKKKISQLKVDQLAEEKKNLPNNSFFRDSIGRFQVAENQFIKALCEPNSKESGTRQIFARHYSSRTILSLDGPSRVDLLKSQKRGDLKSPETPFAQLFTNDPKRFALRKIVFDATGFYLAMDASVGDQINVRFGSSEPPNERNWEDETLSYMNSALGVESVSDGVKAFTGILLQLNFGDPKVITIDEPEAFLHPGLAFILGKELAKGAVNEGKHIFASTHSADFLMGAISSGAEVNIIRLTYTGGVGTARFLPGSDLKTLMQDPLLRSVGVLAGLFFDSVLVGEANADRAFYQEVNERLLAQNDTRALSRTLFLNADNKQTIPRIIAPLRRLGIPAAGVFDIDALSDDETVWNKRVDAIGFPQGAAATFNARKNRILDALKRTGKDYKTKGGVELLDGEECNDAQAFLGDLCGFGLFMVPHGELESWLKDLDVKRTKREWLRTIFEKMGSDPSSGTYVKPGPGDVWDFIGKISRWAKDKNRKGIPT